MDNTNIVKRLNNLAQVDIDAYHAYVQPISSITDNEIKENLISFQKDHATHIENLALTVRKLGGKPIEFSRDFKGFLITGYTTVRGITGDIGILKAMKTNENITNTSYNGMSVEPLPEDIKKMIEAHEKDEKRHLSYIKKKLEE